MRKVIKEGTIVKIKSGLENLRDDCGRIGGLYCDTNMYQYEGQELKIFHSWYDNGTSQNFFELEGISWTWNKEMIEEVSEENMQDLDRICADCGREIEEGEELIYLDHYDKYICDDCLSSYRECYDCGELIHEDDLCTAHDSYGDEIEVCESCRYNNYTQCEECGEWFSYDTMHDYDCYYYCDNCYQNIASDRIYDYHDYPRDFEFYKASDEENAQYYEGAELEVENEEVVNECVDYVYDNLDLMCSRDGSLNGRGAMEMVFDPRTPKSWHEIGYKLEEAFKKLVDNGYRSNDTSTCGLHFHVSRPYQVEIDKLSRDLWSLDCTSEEYKKIQEQIRGLEEKQDTIIDRILLIMETYKQELIKFSRRKDNTWCKWLSDVVTTENGRITSLDYIKKVKHESVGHHRALNLENHNTIEFRIFKGTLNYNTFMASLELVDNITRLCSDLDLPVEKITWAKLTSGEYVSQYVNEKNIHTNRKVVDTSASDRIWAIIKNKKRVKIFNKILKEFDKYYQVYIDRFDNIKNSENWSLICETSGRLREYASTFKQVVDYKNNHEYDNLLYKISDMFNYNMYFESDNEELMAIKVNIKELINLAR